MNKWRQINIILFATFVVVSTSIMHLLGADFLGKQEKPWHLQPSVHEDSLSKKYLSSYSIIDKIRLIDQWCDSSKKRVIILVDGWGIPIDESILQQDFDIFTNVPHKFALHKRLANRTKHAEQVEFRQKDSASIFLFGGDSLEYGRKQYIPPLNYNELLFCQTCNDSIMIRKLDSILTQNRYTTIAWTTQDTKFGEKNVLHSTLKKISKIAAKHSDTQFIIQGTHRPILGDPIIRRQHKSHWVPAVLLNP